MLGIWVSDIYVFLIMTDAGYLGNDAYSVLQATAWIPLLDATEQNGCMQVRKYEGSH